MYWDEFALIVLSHFFAVASPGPDFAIILKHSVQHGRRNGLYTSAGIASGILVHVAYCLLGVALVISSSPQLFNLLKYLAAAYLAYIGIQALRSKASAPENAQQLDSNEVMTDGQAFIKGFLVNALNPKATLFFLSLFTLVISTETPWPVQLGYGIYMAIATWIWFSGLSLVLSKSQVRVFFRRAGHWFDRAIGVVLLILAVRVIWL